MLYCATSHHTWNWILLANFCMWEKPPCLTAASIHQASLWLRHSAPPVQYVYCEDGGCPVVVNASWQSTDCTSQESWLYNTTSHTTHELDLTCQLQAAVEHWLHKPGALCSTLDNCQLFTWLYFHNIKTFSFILCQAERKWFCFIGNTIVSSFSLITTICRCCQRLSTIPLEGGTLTRGLWTTLQQSSKNGTRLTHLPNQSSVYVWPTSVKRSRRTWASTTPPSPSTLTASRTIRMFQDA